jgi:hypothetical protein
MLPDTLRILNLNTGPTFGPEYFALLGVIVGVLITFLGNWILAKRHVHLEFQKALFNRKLDIYLKVTELLWPFAVKQYRKGVGKDEAVPRPYDSYKNLTGWINELTDFVNLNRLLLDESILGHFGKLNALVIADINDIAEKHAPEERDAATRTAGRASADVIRLLCVDIHNAAWEYFKRQYKVEL